MHSVANLATLQTPLATFFPSKKAPKPSHRYCRARSCSPSAAHTPLSLSLCVCSVSLPARTAHTPLSLPLSLSASAQFLSQRAHTPLSLSLSLSASAQFLSQHAHTSLSLSLSASAQFLSQRAHTPLFLSLSLRLLSFSPSTRTSLSLCLSLRLLSFSSAIGREEQRFNSVKHRYYVASLILHSSIAEITAQLLSLSYVYLISSDDCTIINQDFCAD